MDPDINVKEKHRDKHGWNLSEEKRIENLKIKKAIRMDSRQEDAVYKAEQAQEEAKKAAEAENPYFGMRKSKKLKEKIASEKKLQNGGSDDSSED